MNDKNFDQRADRNGHAEVGKEENVKSMIQALETDERLVDTLDGESKDFHRIGVAIKKVAENELPEASAILRNRVLAELEGDGGELPLPVKDKPNDSNGWFTAWRLAMAACLLLAVSLAAILFVNQRLRESVATARVSRINSSESAADEVMRVEAPIGEVALPATSLAVESDDVALQFDASKTEGAGQNRPLVAAVIDQPVQLDTQWMSSDATKFGTLFSNQSGQTSPGLGGPQVGGYGGSFGIEPNTNSDGVVGYYFESDPYIREDRFSERFEDVHEFSLVDESAIFGYDKQGEQYGRIVENAFVKTAGQNALSTFSIDVDTASYSNMRRFLNSRQFPPRDSVRIEELVNYFEYDYPQPKGDDPFSVNMELASCPWNEQHHLLRVGLKGKEVHRDERSPSNLVFLLDVSGSMQSHDKLPLLKQGILMMIRQLSENDSVSIVTYAGDAGLALPPTNGENKPQIEEAINSLNAGGSTNGSAGINLAYEIAQKQFINNGTNRVILATDGDLNVGVTNDQALVKLIKEKASEGVFLTVLGFGTGNLKDEKLEKLADNGNGMYAYIDSHREAHRVLIDQMSGSLETIAKDVKIQIEFNPDEVRSYRLIGYENRMLAAKDFDDDTKDAGEIGAGHTVTALYELELVTNQASTVVAQQPLKYQQSKNDNIAKKEAKSADTEHRGEVLTLSLRYKEPDKNQSRKIQFVLENEPVSFSSASSDLQFASAVASFGMLLRHSKHRGSTSIDWVEATAARNIGRTDDYYRVEFLDLVRKAKLFAN